MFNKKYLFLFAIFLFAMLPFVSSAPPFTTSTTSSTGCTIAPIVRETLKTNQSFDFNFHVFNTSNGVPLSNSTLQCNFHFYNQSGDHVFSTNLKNDPFSEHLVVNEWAERMMGGNISKVGQYAYIIQCNGTNIGCADKGAFTVTNSGLELTTGRSILDIGLLFLFVIFLIGAIAIFFKFDNVPTRAGMLGVSYLLMIAITFIGWNMANDFLLSAPFIVDMLHILFLVLTIGAFPLLIGGFAYYIIMITKIKEIQNLMDHGMSEDDAEKRVSRRKR